MRLFRQTLDDAALNECCRAGETVYFRPAGQYVSRRWVEQMAEFEAECEETGACSHPECRTVGCYRGQWAGEQWICETLTHDRQQVTVPFARLISYLEPERR